NRYETITSPLRAEMAKYTSNSSMAASRSAQTDGLVGHMIGTPPERCTCREERKNGEATRQVMPRATRYPTGHTNRSTPDAYTPNPGLSARARTRVVY